MMASGVDKIIDTGTGTRLFFDGEEGHLWAALEASADTLDEARNGGESFIVANSEEGIDALIAALAQARECFTRARAHCDDPPSREADSESQ